MQEYFHFVLNARGGRGLDVKPFPFHWAGDDLHRLCAVDSPAPGFTPGWEDRRVPPEETFGVEGPTDVARGVEYHFDDAFDVAVRGGEGAGIDPKATGDGRADLAGVELFALNLAAFEDVAGEGLED